MESCWFYILHITLIKEFYAQKFIVKMFLPILPITNLTHSCPNIISIHWMKTMHWNRRMFTCSWPTIYFYTAWNKRFMLMTRAPQNSIILQLSQNFYLYRYQSNVIFWISGRKLQHVFPFPHDFNFLTEEFYLYTGTVWIQGSGYATVTRHQFPQKLLNQVCYLHIFLFLQILLKPWFLNENKIKKQGCLIVEEILYFQDTTD
jgi:hypothetical protein